MAGSRIDVDVDVVMRLVWPLMGIGCGFVFEPIALAIVTPLAHAAEAAAGDAAVAGWAGIGAAVIALLSFVTSQWQIRRVGLEKAGRSEVEELKVRLTETARELDKCLTRHDVTEKLLEEATREKIRYLEAMVGIKQDIQGLSR